MTALAILLCGYSVFCALMLALTHFRGEQYREQPLSHLMGLALLLALGGLQVAHFAWLDRDLPWTQSIPYRMTLFAVAPAFYLFSAPLLQPRARSAFGPAMALHGLPVVLSPLLPAGVAMPLAFLVGAAYMLWLGRSLYALRRERVAFQREVMLLGSVFAIAIGVSALGVFPAALPNRLFFSLYAIAIGAAFLLVQISLGLHPKLPVDVREAAQTAYASSTLARVDCDDALSRLDALMAGGRAYEDADLSLPRLAERLGLSTHQLSELLNARMGKGFSRYLREHRVAAAKAMLRDEPSASVLSVGLSVGFTSQSTFYDAFREIEGMTPGQFRKLNSPAE